MMIIGITRRQYLILNVHCLAKAATRQLHENSATKSGIGGGFTGDIGVLEGRSYIFTLAPHKDIKGSKASFLAINVRS